MKDENATYLLANVMGWVSEDDEWLNKVQILQLLAEYKYDHYQRFGPGKRFIESLALWLNKFDQKYRKTAFDFVFENLIYFSDKEMSHLVQQAYRDVITQERLRIVGEEENVYSYRVGYLANRPRFKELRHKSLYLGLSDGARTNELRRASDGEISNEQIWQAYELGEAKVGDLLEKLHEALENPDDKEAYEQNIREKFEEICKSDEGQKDELLRCFLEEIKKTFQNGKNKKNNDKFNLVWLLDDFSGSGNSYIRFDSKKNQYKGKVKKIYERLHEGDLIDTSNYEVFLLLYIATRQAIDHIEYWSERFTSEFGYKPLRVRVLCTLEPDISITHLENSKLIDLIKDNSNYDPNVFDKHFAVGGSEDARMGFANCGLPVVLSHNTPNNSIFILWGPDSPSSSFNGLFPRISRHKEF